MTRQASDNPVFYVQYVAARTASLVRNARDLDCASRVEKPIKKGQHRKDFGRDELGNNG